MLNQWMKEALSEYNKLQVYTSKLIYSENDVRLDYFLYMKSIYDRFHKGIAYCNLLNDLDTSYIFDNFIKPVDSFTYLWNDTKNNHQISHLQDNSRRFIIDSWSNFEWTISQLLDYLLTNDDKIDFLSKEYNELTTLIKANISEGAIIQKIDRLLKRGQMKKNYITHLPVVRRTDKLFKLIKDNYDRDISDDKEFLNFLGKYRNGLHYNFVYFGNDYSYRLNDLEFNFINGQQIDTPNKSWELQIIGNLNEISKSIFKTIKDDFIETNINTQPNTCE